MNGNGHRFLPQLSDLSMQDIQLEIIRRTKFNAFDGEKIAQDLVGNKSLWIAVLLDRIQCTDEDYPELIKLRDLPLNMWNVDTLYVLAKNQEDAVKLIDLAQRNQWGGEIAVYDADETEDMLGGSEDDEVIISIWWD